MRNIWRSQFCAPIQAEVQQPWLFFLFLVEPTIFSNDSYFMALAAPATPSVASTAIDSETDGEDGGCVEFWPPIILNQGDKSRIFAKALVLSAVCHTWNKRNCCWNGLTSFDTDFHSCLFSHSKPPSQFESTLWHEICQDAQADQGTDPIADVPIAVVSDSDVEAGILQSLALSKVGWSWTIGPSQSQYLQCCW